MTGIGQIISAGALALMLAGCAGKPNYSGHWEGKDPVQLQPGANPVIAETLSTVKIDIHENGRFDIYYQFPMSGQVTYDHGNAVLDVDTMAKSAVKSTIEYRLVKQKDGTALLYPPQRGNSPITMHFEAQPAGSSVSTN